MSEEALQVVEKKEGLSGKDSFRQCRREKEESKKLA